MIVIVGNSTIATNLARTLSRMHDRLLFMTESKDAAMLISSETGAIGIVGSPANPADLDELELRKATVFIAATDREDTNALSALYAREAGVKNVFAVVRSSASGKMLSKIGIIPIDPEEQAARMIELGISRPVVAHLVSIGEGGVDLAEIPCRGSKLVGTAFGEISSDIFQPVAFANGGTLSINKSEKLGEDSTLIIICAPANVDKARRSVH